MSDKETPAARPSRAAALKAAAAKRAEAKAAAQQPFGMPGQPFSRKAPFMVGFLGALGALSAWWLLSRVQLIGGVLILIVVSMFLAVGLTPGVEWLQRKGLKRHWAVVSVIAAVLVVLTLFVVAIVPVASDQIGKIVANAPAWLDQLQHNRWLQGVDERFHVIDKVKEYLGKSDLGGKVFGGVLGAAGAVIGFLADALIVTILTLYFLSGTKKT